MKLLWRQIQKAELDMADDNLKIMQYFSNIQELANTINKSYSYTIQRLHKKNGLDFSSNDWEKIREHKEKAEKNKNIATKSNTEDALRALQTHFEEMAKIIGTLIDEAQ